MLSLRQARWILILMAVAAPVVVFGAMKALKSTSNDPRQWLPRTFAETDSYDWFQQHFGSDEVAVVSWPGCTLDDARVGQLAAALEASSFFDRAVSGPQVLKQLMDGPFELSRTAALSRLRGILIQRDGDTSCLLLSTSAAGRADRRQAVREIEQQASEACGLSASQLRLAGPTVDAAAIDAESRRLLFELAGFAALFSFVVATLRLRSVRLAVMILMVAVYCTAIALAILYFSGGEMNLLMTMLPPLVYVLSISSAVHLANYYRDAAGAASLAGAPLAGALRTSVAQGWLPCALAAATTGIGLASLVMSKIDPIRMFGIYSAVGVVVSVGVLFVLLPAALRLFPPKPDSAARVHANDGALGGWIIGAIGRHHLLFMLGFLGLMIFCASRLPHLKSTVRLQDRFLPASDAVQDYQWLEQHVGPMVPLEVILRFDKEDPRDLLQRLRLVALVQAEIRALDQPVSTMSAVNLSPSLSTGRSIRKLITRRMINSDRTRQRLIDANVLAESNGQQLWRITVRAHAMGDMDYGYFAETLRERIDPLLREQRVQGIYTGVIPLIYKAQRQLLEDLLRSFLAAFAVIAVVLVVVLRSVAAALLAMIPNLFPAVVVFGSIEYAGIAVQIGSVMTASAALGIAVDDTVHFLTWFRRGLDDGLPRRTALREAFGRCSGAMVHTTLICAGGLIVFAFSSFVPILHFAWLMVFLLLAALAGDLVLLPAILAGPLGRCFERTKSRVAVEAPPGMADRADATV